MRQLPLWVAAAWWGSLTTLGCFVVPMLFVYLPSPAMAGSMAAKLFSTQTTVSMFCGVVLLLMLRSPKWPALKGVAQTATLCVVAGVLLALLVELAVAPRIVARDNLALWHRMGSAILLAQWVCASFTFAKLARYSGH